MGPAGNCRAFSLQNGTSSHPLIVNSKGVCRTLVTADAAKGEIMRSWLLLVVGLLSCSTLAAEQIPATRPDPVELEFSGYKFGQSPAANMVCYSGYCKSQAPGGDGRIAFPFSVYETPGAVSTLSGLTIINPRYTFWQDRLYRVMFQVDCALLAPDQCLADIDTALDREYGLTPLASSDIRRFTEGQHTITKDFRTNSGAFVRIRMTSMKDQKTLNVLDLVDKKMAEEVATTVFSIYKQKNDDPPEGGGNR